MYSNLTNDFNLICLVKHRLFIELQTSLLRKNSLMVILYFKDSSKNKFLVIINALVGKSSKNTRTGLGEYRW